MFKIIYRQYIYIASWLGKYIYIAYLHHIIDFFFFGINPPIELIELTKYLQFILGKV
jgi:hypothetical protein